MPTYLPILGYSGANNFCDIPIPNFDDIDVIMNEDIPLPHSNYEWSDKIDKAVFRGNLQVAALVLTLICVLN